MIILMCNIIININNINENIENDGQCVIIY